MEVWKPVIGYESRYEVSDQGQVRSKRTGRILSHDIVKKYHRVSLANGRLRKKKMVHLLVLEAFVGTCPAGMQGNHHNGDHANNALPNLGYMTPSQNVRHSLDVLGVKRAQGERHWSAKLTDDLVLALRAEYAKGGVTGTQLAKRIGVHQATMSHMLIGRTWRHLPCP